MRKVELALLVKSSWILLLSGLIGSCAPGFSPSMPPPNYTGPKAEGPIQKAGHYWVYENAYGRRITAGAGDLIGELRFPLWVGKSWGYEGGAYEEATDVTRTRRRPMLTDVVCEVLSFKQITVIAGNFGAFECRCRCELATPKVGFDRFCGEWTLWYAPEVKNIIRRDSEASEESFELVEYQIPAKEPVDLVTPAAGFYKGKTIRFIVGYAPGGGYDTYTRVMARHISKYIPGNPTIVVQNMTGTGSLIAANYTYNRAKPDGLTVGVWNSGLILRQALGSRRIEFKADRFGWIGAPVRSYTTCAIMGYTGLTTLKDVLNTKRFIKIGATRAGSITYDLPTILNKTLGTNFEVVPGYRGTRTIRRAMREREIDGACWGWESMRVTARSMLDAEGDDQLIPFLTQGNIGDREIAHLPQVTDVIKGEDNRATFRAWFAAREFQRPLSLPPGTPKDRLNILRKAFTATVKDRRFLAVARRSKLLIDYVSGPEIEKLVAQILTLPSKAEANLQFLVR